MLPLTESELLPRIDTSDEPGITSGGISSPRDIFSPRLSFL